MKLQSVTARPGTHSPQVLDLQGYDALELLPSGVILAKGKPARGKVSITLINSWDTARTEIDEPQPEAKQPKAK
jgi:hypothetical protein